MKTSLISHPVRALTAGVLAVAAAAALTPAFAGSAGASPNVLASTVNRNGHCSAHTVWNSNMSNEGRYKIDASFSIDNARTGSRWRVLMKHNGSVQYSGIQTASAAANG